MMQSKKLLRWRISKMRKPRGLVVKMDISMSNSGFNCMRQSATTMAEGIK